MTKKTSLIFTYILVGVIAILLILGAVLKKNYNFGTPRTEMIEADYKDGNRLDMPWGENQEFTVDNFWNTFDNSFKQVFLSSIFSGKIFDKPLVERMANNTEPIISGIRVTLSYVGLTEKNIIKINGKVYHPQTNSSKTVEYQYIVFDLQKDKGLTKTTFYFQTLENEKDKVFYKVSVFANFDNLYDFMMIPSGELDENK